ncbi:MAG: sensor histidine kinase [Bdellovibrionota bacterium]
MGAIASDLTDAEAERQASIAHSSKLSALGEMAAGIAHEIYNPLAVVQVLNEQIRMIALEGASPSTEIVEVTQKIERTLSRITKIVTSLRHFSRESEGDAPENVTVRSLVESVLDFCRDSCRNKNIDILIPEIDPAIRLSCRSVQISQVILNLLINAQHAVENLPEKWIRVSVLVHPERLEIHVVDSGHGIPLEIQKKMFRSFFTTKAPGVGTGLGLSISRSILESHGGTLSIDSIATNTTFVITLPYECESSPNEG